MTVEAVSASRHFEVPDGAYTVGPEWSVLSACVRFGCPPWELEEQDPAVVARMIAFDRLLSSQERRERELRR